MGKSRITPRLWWRDHEAECRAFDQRDVRAFELGDGWWLLRYRSGTLVYFRDDMESRLITDETLVLRMA